MIRLLTAVFLVASFNAVADECPGFSPPPPGEPTKCELNQLNNNEVADADKVMENFNTLGDAIDAVQAPPSDCSSNQLIRWDGSNWVCTNRPSMTVFDCGADAGYCETYCDLGEVVTGGGCDADALTGSYPLSDGDPNVQDAWVCLGTGISKAYIICM